MNPRKVIVLTSCFFTTIKIGRLDMTMSCEKGPKYNSGLSVTKTTSELWLFQMLLNVEPIFDFLQMCIYIYILWFQSDRMWLDNRFTVQCWFFNIYICIYTLIKMTFFFCKSVSQFMWSLFLFLEQIVCLFEVKSMVFFHVKLPYYSVIHQYIIGLR